MIGSTCSATTSRKHPSPRIPFTFRKEGHAMPLFEVETSAHIMIACTNDEVAARAFAVVHYPHEEIIRITHRPRDAWVISKKLLGIENQADPCSRERPRKDPPGSRSRAASWKSPRRRAGD